jgi:hypothetical protein
LGDDRAGFHTPTLWALVEKTTAKEANPMPEIGPTGVEPRVTAVVISANHLLGEGLAAQLRSVAVETTAIIAPDAAALHAALALQPDVVVVERECSSWWDECSAACPHARMVDIGEVVARGCPTGSEALSFEVILEALSEARAKAWAAEQPQL